MSDLGLSTIAQLLFRDERSIDFAKTVAELENVLSRLQSQEVRIAWDCDDFVCFDIPGTRIQLAWSEVDRRGYKACLTVSVGPGERASPKFHEAMCSRLVDRIQSRFDPVAVMWCQTDGAIGYEVIDDLLDALPHLGTVLPEIDTLVQALSDQEARLSARPAQARQSAPPSKTRQSASPTEARTSARQTADQTSAKHAETGPPQARKPDARIVAAKDSPDLPKPRDQELERVRLAFYPGDDFGMPYSTQMRLAVHCLNATLILVWMPLGAAMMIYSLLKGEDMQLSSRVMAVTGTLLALAHSPVGMNVAAMANGAG